MRRIVRRWIWVALAVLGLCLAEWYAGALREVYGQGAGFTFGAAGDVGSKTDAGRMLATANSQTDFLIVPGDMDYSGRQSNEGAWCEFVKARYVKPVALLVGNHEDVRSDPDGFIDDYAACLPDRLGSSGLYGHRYFFDYPTSAPLARFILLDPNLDRGGVRQQYCRSGETANCDWLKARIREAKAAGLWVVVSHHQNCFTIGDKSCEVGAELETVLVQEGVDLLLMGHDHTYQRSKTVALSAGCPRLVAGQYNAACVTAGRGMTWVISAVSGYNQYTMHPSDVEAGWLAAWMPNSNYSPGFSRFTVTAERIEMQYVRVAGTFADAFAIVRDGSAPQTPTATQQPATATRTPTRTPTATRTVAPATATPTAPATPTSTPAAPICEVWATATPTATPEPPLVCVATAVPTATPTATATPTVPPAPADWQPGAPWYGAFFYPWFGNPQTDGSWLAWKQGSAEPPATWFSYHEPAIGLYSSGDEATIYWQLGKLKEARQEVGIASWWGRDHHTDRAMHTILVHLEDRADNPYPNFRWALYYEQESQGDPGVAQLVEDLNYIADTYAGRRAYWRIGGRPVIFVYADASDGAAMAQRWAAARAQARGNFYVVLKVFAGYRTVQPQPDGWHQYAPAVRSDVQAGYSHVISPGFWLTGSTQRLGRDLAAFEAAARGMVAGAAPFKLVTTWNEWGENSGVEPALPVRAEIPAPGHADAYVQALGAILPELEQ